MGKDKKPRKRRDPTPGIDIGEEREPERQTEPKGELVPPPRRPPTAVAAEAPPPQEPVRSQPRRVPTPRAPALTGFLEALRAVATAMLDIADQTADAIRRGLERRA